MLLKKNRQKKNSKGQWWVNDIAYADACHTFDAYIFVLCFFFFSLSLYHCCCRCFFFLFIRLASNILLNFDFMRRYADVWKWMCAELSRNTYIKHVQIGTRRAKERQWEGDRKKNKHKRWEATKSKHYENCEKNKI